MNIHQINCYEPKECPLILLCVKNKISEVEMAESKNGILPKNCPIKEGPVHISLSSKPYIEQEPII